MIIRSIKYVSPKSHNRVCNVNFNNDLEIYWKSSFDVYQRSLLANISTIFRDYKILYQHVEMPKPPPVDLNTSDLNFTSHFVLWYYHFIFIYKMQRICHISMTELLGWLWPISNLIDSIWLWLFGWHSHEKQR